MSKVEQEIRDGRGRVMRALQNQIHMMLVNADMESAPAHNLAQDILHAVMLSDVVDEDYQEQYKD